MVAKLPSPEGYFQRMRDLRIEHTLQTQRGNQDVAPLRPSAQEVNSEERGKRGADILEAKSEKELREGGG
jgi:hypothetical protein